MLLWKQGVRIFPMDKNFNPEDDLDIEELAKAYILNIICEYEDFTRYSTKTGQVTNCKCCMISIQYNTREEGTPFISLTLYPIKYVEFMEITTSRSITHKFPKRCKFKHKDIFNSF